MPIVKCPHCSQHFDDLASAREHAETEHEVAANGEF